MRLLAIDTASRSCSVAVSSEDGILAEVTLLRPQTHARHLMELVRRVLDMIDLEPGQLDGFAVTRGPGSFTGLRIGISTAKGLAFAAGRPLAGISSLQALASQVSETPYLITALLDARRGEVYLARYRYHGGVLKEVEPEKAASPANAARGIHEPCIFVGDAARLYRERIRSATSGLARFVPDEQNFIRASSVARLGIEALRAGGQNPAADLVPVYIRKSDAELNLGAGQKAGKPD